MNIVIWLVVGGVIGWVASLLMGTDGRQGIVLNVVVGIVGAALGGWLVWQRFQHVHDQPGKSEHRRDYGLAGGRGHTDRSIEVLT